MVRNGKPDARACDNQIPIPRRRLPGWIAALGLLLLGHGLIAMTTQTPLASSPKAKPLTAHSDCLRQCHQAHPKPIASLLPMAKGQGALLQGPISTICLNCHQGPPAPATDMGATKLPTWTGVGSSHVDGPFLERSRSFSRLVDRGHVRPLRLTAQCEGCHNVHAKDHASMLAQTAFDTHGRQMQVKPTTVAQVCFACHAGPGAARLSQGGADLGLLFGREAGSSHEPGATLTTRQDLPSLKSGLFKGILDCTSCHDNPNPSGPRGPHFSTFSHLLKASYGREGDVASTGDRASELCYGCHDKFSILANQSFPLHAQHIGGFTAAASRKTGAAKPQPWQPAWRMPFAAGAPGSGQPTACATCHDPHGSQKNPSLIAFDKTVVTRASVGVLEYKSLGLRHGNCTLTCHGYDHIQTGY